MNSTAYPCDYHIHTPLCRHATGWPVEYAERAVAMGFQEIGFADHNPMPEPFDDWRMLREELPRYIESVQEAREKFPSLTIRLGLECDYLPGKESWIEELATLADWDYLIGSVHYLPEGWEVDHPKYISRHTGENAGELWASYWRTYEQCIRSGLFDFVAHPDLPKKFGFRPTTDLRSFYEPAISAMAERNVAFEINTAGLRKDCQELYPAREFLEMANAAGIPLLINSDAHDPSELGAGFAEALSSARAAGYTHSLRFDSRNSSMIPFLEQ